MKIKLSPSLPVTGKAHIVRTFSQQHLDLHIVRRGSFSSIRAIAPETSGVDMEVPLFTP